MLGGRSACTSGTTCRQRGKWLLLLEGCWGAMVSVFLLLIGQEVMQVCTNMICEMAYAHMEQLINDDSVHLHAMHGQILAFPHGEDLQIKPCFGMYRNYGCISNHAAPDEHRERVHIRGHTRDPYAGTWAGTDWPQRVFLKPHGTHCIR
jgi:hypothetical protein